MPAMRKAVPAKGAALAPYHKAAGNKAKAPAKPAGKAAAVVVNVAALAALLPVPAAPGVAPAAVALPAGDGAAGVPKGAEPLGRRGGGGAAACGLR